MARLVGPPGQFPHQRYGRGHQGLERLLPVRQLEQFQAQAVTIIGVNTEVSPLLQGGDHAEYLADRAAHRPGQGIQAHRLFGIGQHFQDVRPLPKAGAAYLGDLLSVLIKINQIIYKNNFY